ncbi:ParB/RepB/Spo0J family partition protein [Streptomyces sp. NPDC059698]|uniref:ParB/RepB/Spo0J family partition protein n=1 Tax=unclassified Streptomyces TaxID=2593676 RepID=UPI0009A1243D|nr:ParB/RepB/Spo0J family partition protein [Streptomyces sp. CB02366]
MTLFQQDGGAGVDPVDLLSRQREALEESVVCAIPISSLVISESPRINGEDAEHVQILADSGEEFPPIWVHKPSMRVIDGVHRVRAAAVRGMSEVAVRFLHGTEVNVFLLAVSANIKHGLPLSRGDRHAAVQRIIGASPEWSDRMVASLTGLSAKRVALIRRQALQEAPLPMPTHRVGKDGRSRPTDGTQGRRRAAEVIAGRPEASLRQIAQAAGISPATAADVRNRVVRGESPVPGCDEGEGRPDSCRPLALGPTADGTRGVESALPGLTLLFDQLRRDPSLRFNDTGRSLLRMFDGVRSGLCEQQEMVQHLPGHCRNAAAELSFGYAQLLQAFGEELMRAAGADDEVLSTVNAI